MGIAPHERRPGVARHARDVLPCKKPSDVRGRRTAALPPHPRPPTASRD